MPSNLSGCLVASESRVVHAFSSLAKILRKRFVRIAIVCAVLSINAFAQAPAGPELDKNLGISTLPLWGSPPSAEGGAHSESSTLTVFVPHPGRGNGTAVIIAPGGAYRGWAGNLEGRQVADWYTVRGVTAFVLKYRLGPDNPYPIPLLDAQRAVRLVRSLSQTYKLSSDRIGIMGFSAGGHLAAMEATTADDGKSDSSDPIERISDRPNFLVLAYAWLNAMQPNSEGKITYCTVLRITSPDCQAWEQKYTPALHVDAKTPSTFLYSTTNDEQVPVQASLDFYAALLKAGVPAEMHLYRNGAHGSGLGRGDEALDTWPILLESWLRGQGLLTPESGTGNAQQSK